MKRKENGPTLAQKCVFHWLNCLYGDFLAGRKAGEQMPCSSCGDRENCNSCPPLNFNIAGESLGLRVEYHKNTERREKANQEEQLAIDCMAQHIKEFLTQSAGKEQADFGKPCGDNCPMWRNGQCKDFDWLKNMKPILNQSRVKISVANPLQTNR